MNPQPVSLADELRKALKAKIAEWCKGRKIPGPPNSVGELTRQNCAAEIYQILAEHAVAEPELADEQLAHWLRRHIDSMTPGQIAKKLGEHRVAHAAEQPTCPICKKPLSIGISWCKTCDFTHAVRCVECRPCGYINEGPCELGKRAHAAEQPKLTEEQGVPELQPLLDALERELLLDFKKVVEDAHSAGEVMDWLQGREASLAAKPKPGVKK